MTPEELRELDEAMALGMGWKKVTIDIPHEKYWFEGKNPSILKYKETDWHPTTDLNQAFVVVRFIERIGFNYHLINSSDVGYWCNLIKPGHFNKLECAATAPLAICRAAKQVFEALNAT